MKTLFLRFLLLFSFTLSSQSNGTFISNSLDIKIPFTITQYSTKNGLPQSRVIDIASKSNGNLIIATANGIVEYDGAEFSNFILNETYKNYHFIKILWSNTSNQLFGFTHDNKMKLIYPSFKAFDKFSCATLKNDSIYALDKQGDVYVSQLNELLFKKLFSTNLTNCKALCWAGANLIIASKKGLYIFNKQTNRTTLVCEGNFFEIKNNQFNHKNYALSYNIACEIKDTSAKKILEINEYAEGATLQDIEFVSEDEIYISSTAGLFELNPDYTDQYTKRSALPSVFLQALFYSWQEKCLFVGTGEKGLLKLQFKNCYSFTAEQGFLEASSLSSVIRNNNGKLTVVDDRGIVFHLSIDTAVKYIDLKTICTSLAMVDKEMYVGTSQMGVLVLKDKLILDTITFPEQLPDPSVQSVYKDSKGFIWVGTLNGLAMGSNSKNIQTFKGYEIKGGIVCFYELKNKALCIGGTEGAYIISADRKQCLHLGKEEGLLGKNVRAFYEDKEGKLWIGTYDGGLYCYNKTKLTSINSLKNAKLDKDAFTIAPDDYGYLFITSNHGLWRVSEEKLNNFYQSKSDYLIPFHYSEETGIVNSEFNGGFQNNFLKTRSNHFYFPSIEGLVLVNPEDPTFRKLNPHIIKVAVNDELIKTKNHHFDENTYSVAFYFSCLSYLKKFNIYFQYKLETSTKKADWSSLQKESSITFKMLPAGNYTFTVRALDAFNDSNPNESSYEFEIDHVFYDTMWFKSIVFLIFLLLLSIVIRLRINYFRKKVDEKERFKRQLAEFELKATHAQMNPHFIFNSLNSIKYYLSINDQKNADNYIDHFSSLLRSFLENGSKDFIELKDEIEILKSYLELEKQRMSPAFTYSIKVAQSLHHLLIPTHLIQPFVENAVKHGINHATKQCNLLIHFYVQDSNLICVIEDDGIGRNRSGEINKQRRTHKSKGIEMVLEKIRIVKEIYKLEILLNIEDKLGLDLQALGTRVEIQIPIPSNEDNHS